MKKLTLILSLISLSLITSAQSRFGDDSDGVRKAKGSKKYDFKVTYINGNTRNVTSSIDVNFCMRTMFLEDKENEEAIYPAETKFIEVTDKDGYTIKGIPEDSLWRFQMNEGKIILISTLPETKFRFAEWIQKDNGDFIPFTPEAITKAVSDNKEASDYMVKYRKKNKMGKTLGYYVAPGLLFLGFFTGPDAIIYDDNSYEVAFKAGSKKTKAQVRIFHIMAVGVFPFGLIYHQSAKKQVIKAIETYNIKK